MAKTSSRTLRRLSLLHTHRFWSGDELAAASTKAGYVLVGADAGSKVDKATRLGVPTLSEEDFEALVVKRSWPGAATE
jgi:DNA ligase (NAD+)